eukprot:GHVH01013906.1.p1 GENE.GHVH01013906.1~~GHVH01013906.1.p1  ORF type:complete len:1004 (+),score=154.63 GHVH01013906.1:1243-4254(+)
MAPAAKKPAIRNPYNCSYAPTDAATCKSCSKPIAKGTIRFEKKVHSPFHEGIDTKMHHIECGWDHANKLYDLKNWSSLRWKDIIYVARLFGEIIDSRHPVVQFVMKCHIAVSNLSDKLSELPESVLMENIITKSARGGMKRKKLLLEVSVDLADALTHGLLPCCPMCKDQLIGRFPTLICCGTVEGVECTFVWNAVDIVSPDNPKLDKLPMAVTSDQLARHKPLRLPASFLNVATTLSILKEHFKYDWPSVVKFGPAEKWLKKSKRERVYSEEEDSADDLDDQTGSGPLVGIHCFPINGKARSFLYALIESSGATLAPSLASTHYGIVSSKHKDDLSLPVINEAIGLDVPVLTDTFLRLASGPDQKPLCLPATCKKGVDYSKYIDNSDLENTYPPGELHRYPSGRYLRRRRFALWFWCSKGPTPLDLDRAMLRIRTIHEKKEEKIMFEVERKKLRKMPDIAPGSDTLTVDYQARAELLALRFKHPKVLVDDDNQAYHAYMTAADVTTGTNKFYKLQVLTAENDLGKLMIYLVKSWGKIGGGGIKDGFRLEPYYTDERGAKASFENMCRSLTGVVFDYRFNDALIRGKYAYVKIKGYASLDNADTIPPPTATRSVQLDENVVALMVLLFDDKKLSRWFHGSQLDLDEQSFKEIDPSQINTAMSVLSRIEDVLITASNGDASVQALCEGLSSQFFSLLPHTSSPTTIDSLPLVRAKAAMLQEFIQTVTSQRMRDIDPVEEIRSSVECKLYSTLQCDIDHIPPEQYGKFEQSAIRSLMRRGPTHKFKIIPKNLYLLNKHSASDQAAAFNEVDNRELLWHGSSLPNWAGILSTGLRCAPAQAPKTGYMFGKGVYFADVASKCAQYCLPRGRVSNAPEIGCLMLSEVVLGAGVECTRADHLIEDKLVDEGHVHARGKYSIREEFATFASSIAECEVDCKLGVGSIVYDDSLETDLLYDEYIVYDTRRVVPRLLVECTILPIDEKPPGTDDVINLLKEGDISEDSDDNT